MARPWKDIGRYGSVGIEFVLTIAICSAIGHWWDGRYGHGGGSGLAVGFLVGVAVGFYNLVRTALGMQRDIERAEAKDPLAGRWTVDEGWLYKPDGDAPSAPSGAAGEPGARGRRGGKSGTDGGGHGSAP
jgi:hypothetical protein